MNIHYEDETVKQNIDEAISIERCPHDKENPYTMVHNDLIRDRSISPACRWMIIYFLSMKDSWNINMSQLVAYLKPDMGRDKVYSLVNEAISAGYMKRVQIAKGGKSGIAINYKYYVSEQPKFKKCFRNPDFQDTEIQYTENTHIKNNHSAKKEHSPKKQHIPPPIPPPSKLPANAGEESFDSSPKPKKNPKPAAFSAQVISITQQMIAIARRCNPVYREPDNLDKFHEHVSLLIDKDQQDPTLLLKVFEWACSDTTERNDFKGWQGIICSNKKKRGLASSPAEKLRDNYSTLYSQMTSQPARKFAPSSNNQRALDAIREAKKDAI